MDVNKTIVLFDNGNETSAAHNVLSHLGKTVAHTWDSSVMESYFSYVRRVLAPGDEVTDPALKKHRQTLDQDLLSRFSAVPGGLPIKERYDALISKLSIMQAQKRIILPSFQHLLAELQRQRHRVSVSVVLRSFGPDVSEAFQEIAQTNPHLSLGGFGMFSKGQLHALGSIDDVEAAYRASRVGVNSLSRDNVLQPFPKLDLFAATAALRQDSISVWSDDYSYWHGNGELAIAGKPFPVMKEPMTLFFDDNAEEKEIIAPVLPADFSCDVADRIVAVDPVLALERDDYFVSILQSKGVLE
jgi:hypothetical protein